MHFPCPQAARSRPARAFTLLELLIVVVLIAGLTGLVLGVGQRAADASRGARAQAELAALAGALEAYRAASGDYPRTGDAASLLQALLGRRDPAGQALAAVRAPFFDSARFHIARPDTPDLPRDPSIDAQAVLLDPWGRPYRYAFKTRTPWTNPGFVLYTAGPDGADEASLLTGGYADRTAAANQDNLEALTPR